MSHSAYSSRHDILEQFVRSNPQAFSDFVKSFEEDHETKYLLNVEATQFPLGKTKKTLDRISLMNAARIHITNSDNNNQEDKDHTISIIISSCNLAETEQWVIRCKKEFGRNLNICTISSKEKNHKYGSGNTISNFTHTLATVKKESLPNILLMCCHSKRVCFDLIELLEAVKTRLRGEGLWNFKFNIFIDEADKNIGLVSKALKEIKQKNLQVRVVDEVHFITATPSDKFWKTLRKIGIENLDNFDYCFGDNISREERKNAEMRYNSILTNEFKHYDHPHRILNAFDYIKSVVIESGLVNINERQIIFAPGENKIKSHNEIRDWFLKKGFWVFYHNGKFKGFINPKNNEKTSIDEFREQNGLNKTHELREVFVVWSRLQPTASLAITGFATIVRGLTFNTTGFNFTKMIFSACHTNNLADFVQLLGRACGNKEYCKILQIIGLKEPFEKAKKFVRHILELKNEQIVKYDYEMFKLKKANLNTVLESYNTEKEAVERLKAVFLARGELKYPKFKTEEENMRNGFYSNTLRNNSNVVESFDYVVKNKGWGIGNGYRTHLCYKDVTDKNTLCYVICYDK